jgi:3-oxoacid CoA-transferase subunit B
VWTTGKGVVDRVITDLTDLTDLTGLAVLDGTPEGFRLVELAPGVTVEEVAANTGAPLDVVVDHISGPVTRT